MPVLTPLHKRNKPAFGAMIEPGDPSANALHRAFALNEGGGLTLYDLARPGSNATLATFGGSGLPAWVGTSLGTGLSVTAGATIQVPHYANIVAGDFAVRVVHKPASWADYTTLFDKGTGSSANERQLSLFVDASGNLNYYGIGSVANSISIATAMTAGLIWDLVISRTGSTVTAYVNGVAKGTWTEAGTTDSSAAILHFGANSTTGGAHYSGVYILMQVWTRALQAGEVVRFTNEPYPMYWVRPLRRRLVAAAGGSTQPPRSLHQFRMRRAA